MGSRVRSTPKMNLLVSRPCSASQAGELALTLTGSVRHHAKEKEKPMFTGSTSICRGSLAKSLLNKASRMPDVSVHYGCTFSKVDMGRR